MATKSRKIAQKNIELFYCFKWECLRRRPGYKEAFKKYSDFSNRLQDLYNLTESGEYNLDEDTIAKYRKEQSRLHKEMKQILNIYRTETMPDPDGSDQWMEIYTATCAVVKNPENELEVIFESLTGKENIDVKIDIWRDKKIIQSQLLDIIDRERKYRKSKGFKSERFDRSPHLTKIDRYFKVFDYRNQKPPISYDRIVANMQKLGYYKKTTLEKAINLVKKDYQTAFLWIYGIPYKEFDKKELRKSDFKGCGDCSKKRDGSCKELCAEAAYAVSLVEVKRKEKLFDRGVTDVIRNE